MIKLAVRSAPAARPRSWSRPGLIIALIAGLLWMHALGTGHHSAPAAATGLVSSAIADPCQGGGSHRDCPSDLPEHPGPVCQAAAVPGGAAAMAVPDQGAGFAWAGTDPPVRVTVATSAVRGSGCGPPSLTLLSISRT
jgi:hypothetical protein